MVDGTPPSLPCWSPTYTDSNTAPQHAGNTPGYLLSVDNLGIEGDVRKQNVEKKTATFYLKRHMCEHLFF